MFILFLLVPLVSGGLGVWFVRRQRARKGPVSWSRLLAGNALMLLFLASGIFVAGEAYYRFIYDTTDSVDFTKVSQRWFQRYYKKNSAGYRDNVEYSLAIEPGKRRVTFVGDSFTAGHGIKSVEDRFPNRLRAAHPEWDVHVLADLALDTDAELGLMYRTVRSGYQLDQVVLVYCLNDVADLFPDWEAACKALEAKATHENWLCRNSYLVNVLYYRYQASHTPYLKDYFNFVAQGYRGELWERQKQRLTVFRDLIQARGGRLSVVTFPFLHALGPDYKFQPAHDELNRFWEQLKVPHLDLLTVYSNLPPRSVTVGRFDAHPNEAANLLAANAIEEFLKSQMQSTNSPPAKP